MYIRPRLHIRARVHACMLVGVCSVLVLDDPLAALEPGTAVAFVRATGRMFFFNISVHADGERRGPVSI